MSHYLSYLGVISIACIYLSQQTVGLDLQPKPLSDAPNSTCSCVPYYLCKNGTINTDGEGIIDIRKDDGPCKNYLLTCCNEEDRSTTSVQLTARPSASLPKPSGGCGYRRPNGVGFTIAGDKANESQFGEFPWTIAVLANGRYQCGGSLIHPRIAVTAAHCVTNRDKKFSIRAGEWDTQHVLEPYPHQDRDVASVAIHPDFYSGGLFNDVALLVLTEAVNVTDNVDVVCLPPRNFTASGGRRSAGCLANGWGADVFESGGDRAAILKKIELEVVGREECEAKLRATRLGERFKLHESFLCAGGEARRDTCIGDGGSPLVCPVEGQVDRYFQAGIVSWGIGCGDGVPGVYANVAVFRHWIDEQMKANNIEF